MSNKMWGGRFAEKPAAIMQEINASIGFDYKLAAQDIAGSLAHVEMLAQTGLVSPEAAEAIARINRNSRRNRERRLHLFASTRRHSYEYRVAARRP